MGSLNSNAYILMDNRRPQVIEKRMWAEGKSSCAERRLVKRQLLKRQ